MILVIVLAILLGLYNQRREIRKCFHRILGKTSTDVPEGSQTPLQQVNTHSPPPYQGHSGEYHQYVRIFNILRCEQHDCIYVKEITMAYVNVLLFSGSYMDQPQEAGYPTEQPSGYAGYLPVSQKADGSQNNPSGYTYNTESAYAVKF